MTPKQFAERMREIGKDFGGDIEAVHSHADKLLMSVMVQLGYEEGIVVYEALQKWYA